jgi:hypothetical protein
LHEKEQLLDRVATLTQEATRLPRSAAGYYRREQIEWELIQCYRHLADVFEQRERHCVLEQMWKAIETNVKDVAVRDRIKQAWLQIRA